MDMITMSTKEINRKEMMDKIIEKRIGQKAAAAGLGISVRQVKRLVQRYRKEGTVGLISKQRGKPSNHQLPEETRQRVVDLVHSTYSDFGPTLAHEKLVERDGLRLSISSVRKMRPLLDQSPRLSAPLIFRRRQWQDTSRAWFQVIPIIATRAGMQLSIQVDCASRKERIFTSLSISDFSALYRMKNKS